MTDDTETDADGVPERAVQRAKTELRRQWFQADSQEEWWDCAMECKSHLRNVHDKLAVATTASEKRFDFPFGGPVIPFGAKIRYKPISFKEESRLHHVGTKFVTKLFMAGDLRVADREDIGNLSTPEVHVKRFNRREATRGYSVFPCGWSPSSGHV